MTPIEIKKNTGLKEDFSDSKLVESLKRAGSDSDTAKKILVFVKKRLYPGITTNQIYRMAFEQLKKASKNYAANYSLKKAILGFGPSGYFFEKFVAAMFREMGYETEVEKIFKGRCVDHEVDVVAVKDGHTAFMECKFHNTPTKKNDVKTALYVQARHLDLKESGDAPDFDDYYLVSNAPFSKDAIQYSQCVGLRLIGLNSPDEKNIHAIIRELRLHPITCLKRLRVRDKNKLMELGVMLCREVIENPQVLKDIGLPKNEQRSILNEIKAIIKSRPVVKGESNNKNNGNDNNNEKSDDEDNSNEEHINKDNTNSLTPLIPSIHNQNNQDEEI